MDWSLSFSFVPHIQTTLKYEFEEKDKKINYTEFVFQGSLMASGTKKGKEQKKTEEERQMGQWWKESCYWR